MSAPRCYLLCFYHRLAFCSLAVQVVPGTRSRLLCYYQHDKTCQESHFALHHKHGQDRMTPMLTVDERIDSFTRGTRSWPHPDTFRATPSSVRHKAATCINRRNAEHGLVYRHNIAMRLSLCPSSLVVSIVACRGRILLETVLDFSRQRGLLSLREISRWLDRGRRPLRGAFEPFEKLLLGYCQIHLPCRGWAPLSMG